ncbi:MAG: 4-(cytidine 5'-diphospho)-2-C-methyl-D-erythritol kinase [Roseburia sp.]|nr:4-(cytidine 5'-diphospho)-2-C-methyl-D-erythritol kinase [Roseburia sp.]MCM1097862.1 4-(cytidine 5'-diphospho)-2-C-methyl-D-erythritol kinase [Ruminococcus flavefaciens]
MNTNRYTLKAYAKINLGLDVLRRRPDGYHEVSMVMQSVGLWDELTLERTEAGIFLTTDSGDLPADQSNLAYRAALLMLETWSVPGGVRIHLQKNIPIAAGMAGGSADAAAVMKGMNHLFGLGLSVGELMERSVVIGADVPYCILGGTALAEGIGERLTPLPPAPGCFVLIARPDISVSTREVYQGLELDRIRRHPDIGGMVSAVRAGDLSGILSRMENVLETVTVPAHPVIASLKEELLRLGAAGSLMSGSGPTVFGLFPEEAAAREAFRQLQGNPAAKQIFLTTFI